MKKQFIFVTLFLLFNLCYGFASCFYNGGAIIVIQGKTQTVEYTFPMPDNKDVNPNVIETFIFQNGQNIPIEILQTDGKVYTVHNLPSGQYDLTVIIDGFQYRQEISVF